MQPVSIENETSGSKFDYMSCVFVLKDTAFNEKDTVTQEKSCKFHTPASGVRKRNTICFLFRFLRNERIIFWIHEWTIPLVG